MEITIDLANYCSGKNVLVGKKYGYYIKMKTNIDYHYSNCDKLNLIIPPNIFSINPSFLEQIIFELIKEEGLETFEEKFSLIHKGKYACDRTLGWTIERVQSRIRHGIYDAIEEEERYERKNKAIFFKWVKGIKV